MGLDPEQFDFSGIAAGDYVRAINDVPVRYFTLDALRQLLRHDTRSYTLMITHGSSIRRVRLQLREIV